MMTYSPHQLAYCAQQLTRRAASDSMGRMAGALLDAQVDLNPHQINAALFATSNPRSKGGRVFRSVAACRPCADSTIALGRPRPGATEHARFRRCQWSNVVIRPALLQQIDPQKALVMTDLESRNLTVFSHETEKLDAWADDLKIGLQREIKDLDRQIKEARTKSKGAATLSDKLQAQKEQRDLEGQRDKKRREPFDRQDQVQARRDSLIEELEQ